MTVMQPKYSADQLATIEHYRQRLLSGEDWTRAGIGYATAGGFQAIFMVHEDLVSNVLQQMATLARINPRVLAPIATRILKKINPYAARRDFQAALVREAAAALHEGYDDVIARTGPEPCRASDAKRAYTLEEKLLVEYYTNRAVDEQYRMGWCASYLMRECSATYSGYSHALQAVLRQEQERLDATMAGYSPSTREILRRRDAVSA